MIKTVQTKRAPEAIGPYAQATVAGGFVFCSGQIPLDPATGELVPGGIAEQTTRVLENLKAVLEAAGAGFDSVASVNVYLTNLGDFAEMNAVYSQAFGEHKPARVTVGVSALPRGAAVEISCLAVKK